MPKLNFVKKARNNIYSEGTEDKKTGKVDRSRPADKDDELIVAKGDSYYWWKFRFGGKRISKNKPRRSQLTQSEFYSTLYDLEDSVNDAGSDQESVAEALSSAADEVRSLGEEQSSKRDNMPESLQDSDTGSLLEERASECERLADELEQAESEIRNIEIDESAPEDEGSTLEDEIQNVLDGISWDIS